MVKIVIMSDNHGNYRQINEVLKQQPDADFYVHCGDHEGYDDQLEKFIAVKGNNDWSSDLKNNEFFEVEGYRIGVTHGTRFGYFNREETMIEFANENDLNILLSGHTHMPMNVEIENILLINPGSTSLPRGGSIASYAILTIEGNKKEVEFVYI